MKRAVLLATRPIVKSVRASVALLCVAASWCAVLPHEARAQQSSVISTLPDANAADRGEVAVVALDGATTFKLRGLRSPRSVAVQPDGRFVVVDPGRREALLFAVAPEGLKTEKRWTLPDGFTEPAGVSIDVAQALTLVDRFGSITKIGADSQVIFSKSFSAPYSPFSTAVELDAGRLLIANGNGIENPGHLYVFNPADQSLKTVTVSSPAGAPAVAPNMVAGGGSSIFAWRLGQGLILKGSVSGDVLNVSAQISAAAPIRVAEDSEGGIFQTLFDGKVFQSSSSGAMRELFQFFPPPDAMAYDRNARRFIFTYQFPAGASWPEEGDRWFPVGEPFNWRVFWQWTLGALGLSCAWLVLALRRTRTFEPDPHAAKPWPQPSFSLTLTALALVAAGLTLAAYGHSILLAEAGRAEWLPSYLTGAILAGVGMELFRRRVPLGDEPLRFAEIIALKGPAFRKADLIPLIAILGLSGYIFSMGISKSFIGVREGAFAAALVLALAVVVADLVQARREMLRFVREEWIFMLVPLVAGGITLFYNLLGLPEHCHFDFTFNSFYAAKYIAGGLQGAWEWGYVPAPVIGALPEIAGILIGGTEPLGFRIGNSLFNLTAVLGVYLLGRTYRNKRVGFWAALIIAGNIPFIHFGRLESNGSTATTALWALTLFVLALRYQRTSLWLWLGIVSAFSFYQWPVARVGLTAAGFAYLLILLRYPLSQLRRFHLALAGLAGFAIMVAPMIPIWIASPHRFMPRAGESLTAVTWSGGWFSMLSEHPTVQLFYKSLGWVFSEQDKSSQGTISPGFNSFEAVLFACGLVILLIEGWTFNVLLLALLVITLLVCGAWAVGPPWYTRLLPTAPVVAVVAARALEGAHNVTAKLGKRGFWAVFVVVSVLLVWVSPVKNFGRYVDLTIGEQRHYPGNPNSTLARKLHSIGPNYQYILLARGNSAWEIKHQAGLGDMLPYIMNLRLKEVYEVEQELPVRKGEAKGFVVQASRQDNDIPSIKQHHPDARIEPVKAYNGDLIAVVVLVDGK